MRLLIAGWQGQLARALVEIAPKASDIQALAVGRPGLDLCQPSTIVRAMSDFGPDVVINAAAYTAVDKAESEPDAAFALNRDGAGMLAEAAAKRGAAIIHISTDYVFDGTKPEPYIETDATGPLNIYGRSKLGGEAVVAAANPRHVILRTSWVHSATGNNFVKTMLRLGAERPSLRVVDDQIGSPTYAPHLADAVLEISRQIGRSSDADRAGIYHASGAGAVSWCGLAREVFRVSASLGGVSVPVEAIPSSAYPTPARRPMNSRLDCSKLDRSFGVRLPDWEVGVENCVRRLLQSA